MPHPDRAALPDVAALLERVEAVAPVEVMDVVAAELAVAARARDVGFLIADHSGRALVRLGPEHAQGAPESAQVVPVAGTAYDTVLRTQVPEVRDGAGGGAQVIVPVTVRGDAIGVLELWVPTRPDRSTVAELAAFGHALGYVVVVTRRYTDLFEWGQRTIPLALSAEIQRRLLPAAFTCEAGQVTVAGWLEPASTIGGDTFDYTLDRTLLHLSITDAVGHDVAAAMLATVLVAAVRNARRLGLDLAEQARMANDELVAHSPVGEFVTGQLVRIDLERGCAQLINAGHPPPLRLRAGRTDELALAVDLPFGLQAGREFTVQEFALQPGDRILFLTDGMLEGRADQLDIRHSVTETAALHPREVVRALGDAVLAVTAGRPRDDATVLCLDWYGGSARRPDSSAGASRRHASAAPDPFPAR